MELRITQSAKHELDAIGSYIAQDNPVRAETFVSELLGRCFALTEHPLRYPVATVRRGRELRRCPYGKYLIFYSVLNEAIEINHVVHAARNYARLLFPDA
jgi:toxin ParE1/3/4